MPIYWILLLFTGMLLYVLKAKLALQPVVLSSSWLSLPADGGLAVGRPLCGAESLAHLSLRQTQRQTTDFKCFGKFPNLLQIHTIHFTRSSLRV